MNDISSNVPTIIIDQQRSRIRIYKQTLHLLGDPQLIYLLVNPEDQMMVICRTDIADNMTHRIARRKIITKQSYELYSRNLIQALRSICADWEHEESYKLRGELISPNRVVRFDLRHALPCLGKIGDIEW